MAAIFEPHRLPEPTRRPELRLVAGGRTDRAAVDPDRVPVVQAVALLVLVLIVAVGAVAIGRGALAGAAPAPASSGAAAGAPSADAGTTVVVRSGDTLWSIARQLQPAGDVRALVDRLVAANGGGPLVPGDRVVVPA